MPSGRCAAFGLVPLGKLSASVPRRPAAAIVFERYVAYAVTNESYGLRDDEARCEGKFFRSYTKSRFLDYVRRSTIASDEYPGPYAPYGVIYLDHIIDVASAEIPSIRRLEGP